MNIGKLLSKTASLIKYNLFALTKLEIAYRLLSVFLFIPLFSFTFRSIMKITGYSYLTLENILGFLTNPMVVLLLIVLLLMIAIVEVWHIGAVIIILDQSAQQRKASVFGSILYCVKNSRHFWKNGKPAMVLYILFILPFLNLGTGLIGSIRIPEFIMDTILTYRILVTLLCLVYFILLTFVLRWLFSMHYVIAEKKGFKDGAKQSAKLAKGNQIRFLISLAITHILIVIAFAAIFFPGEGLILALNKMNLFAADILISVNGILLAILVILFSALAIPISFAMTTVLFYEQKEKCQEPVVHIISASEANGASPAAKARRIFGVSLSIIIIGCGVLFVRGIRHGDFNLNIEHIRTMEVSAHRGASAAYPENTMAAFRGAVSQNADWIELDVQQSSDGRIFVMHDTNFLRTTGVDKNCWEMTWDEISQLDAGSFFSDEFKGEPVPLLEEVIDFAKWSGIRLNIELKPTGHETDFEKKVIEIINRKHFSNSCVITSQEYDVLKNIKLEDPSIRTVYVMAVAVGELEDLEFADDFSIEATFVTEELVSRMHKLEKQVYAWTIDSEENINKMIEIGVDNIISNCVPLAKACVEKSKTSNIITDLLEEVLQL